MTDASLFDQIRARDTQAVRQQLAAGADLQARDAHGWTPLCWAAGGGDAAIVRLLLDHGADALATDAHERTPYLIALAAGHVPAARLLAEAEARQGTDGVALSCMQGASRPYCRAYAAADLRQFPAFAAVVPAERDAESNTAKGTASDTANGLAAAADISGDSDIGSVEARRQDTGDGSDSSGSSASDSARSAKSGDSSIANDDGDDDSASHGAAEMAADADILFLHRDLTVTRTAVLGEAPVFDGQAIGWPRFCADTLGFLPPDDFDLALPADSAATPAAAAE